MSMSTADATAHSGWYAVGGGRERYWDGSDWTEQLRSVPQYVQVSRIEGLLARLTAFVDTEEITPN
jgi:Protein of unknown function (DUF2510)